MDIVYNMCIYYAEECVSMDAMIYIVQAFVPNKNGNHLFVSIFSLFVFFFNSIAWIFLAKYGPVITDGIFVKRVYKQDHLFVSRGNFRMIAIDCLILYLFQFIFILGNLFSKYYLIISLIPNIWMVGNMVVTLILFQSCIFKEYYRILVFVPKIIYSMLILMISIIRYSTDNPFGSNYDSILLFFIASWMFFSYQAMIGNFKTDKNVEALQKLSKETKNDAFVFIQQDGNEDVEMNSINDKYNMDEQ